MTDHTTGDTTPHRPGPLPTAPFGSTGHQSTRIIFGGAALGAMSQESADRTMEQVHALGINHLDTAASYGESELRLAPYLRTHRREVFLATKTEHRTGSEARAELERSLERLGVDSVDLIQLHNLVEDDEWTTAFGADGAVAALDQARAEGLCRFIGVTGHGVRIPSMHRRSLAEFAFDSVLFPYNHSLMTIGQYRDDAEALIEECARRGVAMQTIKSVARRRWTNDDDPHYSWYEPLFDAGAVANAVHFVLGREIDGGHQLFLNSPSDVRLLDAVAAAASAGGSVPDEAALARDREAHGIVPLFDGVELERI